MSHSIEVKGGTLAKRAKKTQSTAAKSAVEDVVQDTTSLEEAKPTPIIEVQDADVTKSDTDAVMPAKEAIEPPKKAQPEVHKEAATVVVQPIESRENTVLLPLILGGIIAAGLGYGAAYMTRPQIDIPLGEQIAIQAKRVDALESAVSNIPASIDVSPLTMGLEETATNIAALTDAQNRITETFAALEARISEVEKQPSEDGTLQEAALAAYERELDTLRVDMVAQQERLAQVAIDASAQLEATRAEAVAIEENAVENARNATARAALARVQGGLESGIPIGPALADLESALGSAVPTELTIVSDGAPTMNDLQNSFPEMARTALAAARAEGVSGETDGGVTGFLRNQFDVRSVAPKDGADVDSILSRAEAALNEGSLNETLAELDALPEVARASLTDWRAQAEMRVSALAAADTLSLSLNAN